ncbi:MAG TPA: lipoate--protein ligase family protein [Micrococcaceae bacterium]
MAGGRPLAVYRQKLSLGAPGDLDFALTLLARARAGEQGPLIRLYRPQPTLAFGQRDANLPGFDAARDAAARHGFEPVVRKAGGRAAAYHPGCLVVDHIEPQQDAMVRAKARFGYFGELLAGALRDVGVDAGVGEIPGEYCPGEFTVHGNFPGGGAQGGVPDGGAGQRDGLDGGAGGCGAPDGGAGQRGAPDGRQVKLVGTAQRVVSGAWLFSSVIVVEDSAPLRAVLTDCYAALGLDWDPETAGGAADLVPGLEVAAVEAAVLRAYQDRAALVAADLRNGSAH